MSQIAGVLERLQPTEPVTAGGLTMIPLLGGEETDPGYLTLDQGLARGTVRVREVSENGSVPELLVLNEDDRPVLILDGEELMGAKQNRIANLTILVPGRSRLGLPVSCVEAGRWQRRSQDFTSPRRAYYASGRALKARSVTDSFRRTQTPTSNQRAIWDDIASKSARLASESPTAAMDTMYERRRADLEAIEAALAPRPHQVGAAFASDGAFLGVDVFDSAVTWRLLAPKLLASYGLEVHDPWRRRTAQPALSWPSVVERVRRLQPEVYPALGLGSDVRLDGATLHGAGLVVGDRVIHLALFSDGAA